ncbi:predicted protein [Streptomyces iranensis]|uniref:Uncharacterized protein n=1 Tax=Streptomyces iranensis TaxID=576784 RepID=A0A061ACI4_9ACTN|nr:predicted protein [Streptomyces iranensis]
MVQGPDGGRCGCNLGAWAKRTVLIRPSGVGVVPVFVDLDHVHQEPEVQ